MMRCPAGLDPDLRRRKPGEEIPHLPPPQPLAQHRRVRRIHAMQLKNTLGRVHTKADKLIHGRLPCLRSATTSFWHSDAVGGRPPQQLSQHERVESWVPALATLGRDDSINFCKALCACEDCIRRWRAFATECRFILHPVSHRLAVSVAQIA